MLIKESIYQEHKIIIVMYAPNNRAQQYISKTGRIKGRTR